MRFYSQSTGCTYLTEIHGEAMPSDVLVISDADFQMVIASPEPGMFRVHEQGLPVLAEPLPSSAQELGALERHWRDAELQALAWLRDRHRDQVDMGIAAILTAEKLSSLLCYMQQLRDWPQAEAFPDTLQRPRPPTWLSDHIH